MDKTDLGLEAIYKEIISIINDLTKDKSSGH